ncbi:MAG: hypothetical protein Q8P79_02130 [Nanoarchaeota archaeon]|nr:hypothetical protein [Nanoarchaeota archaeon]
MGKIREPFSRYDTMKKEIVELRQRIINYFALNKYSDVTLSNLFKELDIDLEDLDFLQYCLDELVEEKYLEKVSSLDHYEYGPGEKIKRFTKID